MDQNQILALLGKPSPTLEREVEDKITECINLVHAHISDVKIKRPTVSYDLKGHTAGQAIGADQIRLNLHLLNKYREDMLNDTLPHELAHCVVQQLWPTAQAHGSHWAYVMEQILNLPATRCHNYETVAARTRTKTTYLYDCGCPDGHEVSSTIHNRIQRGRQYKCRRCGRRLT